MPIYVCSRNCSKRSGAPVLSRKEIDIIGENLVSDFNPDAMHTPQEIDIDLFVQDYLGADQDFQYLSHCGVYLGMTVFNDTDKVPVYDPIQKSLRRILQQNRKRSAWTGQDILMG